MYAIATVVSDTDERGWVCAHELPTFFLDENVQGIVNEQHASAIALGLLTAGGPVPAGREYHISAVRL